MWSLGWMVQMSDTSSSSWTLVGKGADGKSIKALSTAGAAALENGKQMNQADEAYTHGSCSDAFVNNVLRALGVLSTPELRVVGIERGKATSARNHQNKE